MTLIEVDVGRRPAFESGGDCRGLSRKPRRASGNAQAAGGNCDWADDAEEAGYSFGFTRSLAGAFLKM
jgi:hypothetical protein